MSIETTGDMSSVGEIELHSKSNDQIPLLNKKRPERPQIPQQHDHQHELECQDKYRPNILGHAYHWSELLCLIFLLSCGILGTLNETGFLQNVESFVLWIVCASICFLGSIFLWNIGWVETDAAYSRKIANFCDDIEQEAEYLSGNIDNIKNEMTETGELAAAAAKQTAKMAKECGVVDANGNVVMKNLKEIENVLNSPDATGFKTRQRKINTVLNMTNFQSKRANAYHDMITVFKVTARNSNSDSSYFKITDKKRLKKINRVIAKYNKECKSFKSEQINLDDFAKADANDDGQIGLFEFCEYIYHKVIQRELGAEPRKVFDMQEEIAKAKKRIAEIDKVIEGKKLPEEVDDFEIDQSCVAFAKPPPSNTN